MPEEQNQEQIEFMSQLEIQLSVAGVENTYVSLQEIASIDKELLRDVSALKNKYGGFDKAIAALIKRHKSRAAASAKAGKVEQSSIKKLLKGYRELKGEVRGYAKEVTRAGTALVMPSGLGGAVSATLDYNKSLLATAASVNRLGIGIGFMQVSLERISKETSLTRRETVHLFDQYQESMRFVSLQQFEGMLKRIQTIVGANSQEMGKMQNAIAAVSQEYPGLAMGLANMQKASGGMASAEKAIMQERVRNLYFIGKIGDAQYKQLTSYISGSQQAIGVDKARQREMQTQIEAANQFKRQWESASLAIGRGLLPYVQKLAGWMGRLQDYTKDWKMSLLKIAGVYAGLKIGMGAASALGGMALGGIRKGGLAAGGMAVRGVGKLGGGILTGVSKLLGKRGGVVGKLAGVVSRAGKGGGLGALVGGAGTPVFVTNWPVSLGPAQTLRSAGGMMQKELGLLKGKGGIVGGLKGAIDKSRLGGFMKSTAGKGLGIGLALQAGSMAAKWGGEKLAEKGMVKTGAAVGLGGSAAGIGALAATGAAIGSLVPVIGTAIGGAAGALIGVAKEWGNLKTGFAKLFSDAEDKKKKLEPKPHPDLIEEIEAGKQRTADIKALQVRIEKGKEEDIASLGEKGIAALYLKIDDNLTAAREKLAEIREQTDRDIAAQFKQKGLAVIDLSLNEDALTRGIQDAMAIQKKEVDILQKYLDDKINRSYDEGEVDEEQLKSTRALLESAKARYKAMAEISDEEEKGNTLLKEARDLVTELSARQSNLDTLIAKQKDLVSSINGLYQAQIGYIDAVIKRMSISGDIDIGGSFENIRQGLNYLDAEVSAQRTLLSILSMKDAKAIKAAAAEQANNKNISSQNKAMFKELADINLASLDHAAIQQREIEANTVIEDQLKRRTELLAKAGNMYSDTLKLVQAQATRAGLLVQLADNYAIGVGASAKLRMQEFNAQGQIIRTLRDRLGVEREAYMESIRRGESDEDNLALRTKMKETENEMLQAQIKQASTVRAMRDAWISAISAMNTGMDGFTEIIMNAEQNTAQIQRLDGAVRSSVSGAYALRDAFGRVIEDVGFQGSEVMNQMGQIYGRMGRQPGEAAYITAAEKRAGITEGTGGFREVLEAAERGEVMKVAEKTITDAQHAVGGGLMALAAAGHRFTLSVQAAQDSFSKGVVDGGSKTGKAITGAGDDFVAGAKKATKGLSRTGRRMSTAGAGTGTSSFIMGAGIRGYKLDAPKDEGKWQKALKEAPRDTLPRLIVNQKADAVPVFVVNLSDLKGGGVGAPTEKEVKTAASKLPEITPSQLVENAARALKSLRAGAAEISQMIKPGEEIKISEALKTEGLSTEGKKLFKYMRNAGGQVLNQADIQASVAKAEKQLADIKLEAIKKERELIAEKTKLLGKAESRIERGEEGGYLAKTAINSAAALRKEIAQRKKNIEAMITGRRGRTPVSVQQAIPIQTKIEKLRGTGDVDISQFTGISDELTDSSREYLKNMQLAGKTALTGREVEALVYQEREAAIEKEKVLLSTKLVDIDKMLNTKADIVKAEGGKTDETIAIDIAVGRERADIKNIQNVLEHLKGLKVQQTIDVDMNFIADRAKEFAIGQAVNMEKQMRVMGVLFKGIEPTVEEELTSDPLQIYYKNITREVIRVAKELGLPPAEVLTYYSGFTKEIFRMARETGLPPSEVVATYTGFDKELEFFADQHEKPPSEVKQIFTGFVEEVYSAAKAVDKPPEVIEEHIVGYTKALTREADEQGISLEKLIVTYDGVTAGLKEVEREVLERGIFRGDLLLSYSGETAVKEKIIRQIVETARPDDEPAEVVYDNIITQFQSKLVYSDKDVPRETIPGIIMGANEALMQHVIYEGDVPEELEGEIAGVKKSLLQHVIYKDVPLEALPGVILGAKKNYEQSIVYENIEEEVPGFIREYMAELEQYTTYDVLPPEQVNASIDKVLKAYVQYAEYDESQVPKEVSIFIRDMVTSLAQSTVYPVEPPMTIEGFVGDAMSSVYQRLIYHAPPKTEVPAKIYDAIENLRQYAFYPDPPMEKVKAEIGNIVKSVRQKGVYAKMSDEVKFFVSDVVTAVYQEADYPIIPPINVRGVLTGIMESYEQRLDYPHLEEDIPVYVKDMMPKIEQYAKLKTPIPSEVMLDIYNVVDRYKQEAQYNDFAKEVDFFISDIVIAATQNAIYKKGIADKIEVVVENMKTNVIQTGVYKEPLPGEISAKVINMISNFIQSAKYDDGEFSSEILMEVIGMRKSHVAELVESEILPDQIPVVFSNYKKFSAMKLEFDENPFDRVMKMFSQFQAGVKSGAMGLQDAINRAASDFGMGADDFVMDFSPAFGIIENISQTTNTAAGDVFDAFAQLNDVISSMSVAGIDTGRVDDIKKTLYKQSSAIFDALKNQVENLEPSDRDVVMKALPKVVGLIEPGVSLDETKVQSVSAELKDKPESVQVLLELAKTVSIPVKSRDIQVEEAVAYYDVMEKVVALPMELEGKPEAVIFKVPEKIEEFYIDAQIADRPEDANFVITNLKRVYEIAANLDIPQSIEIVANKMGYLNSKELWVDYSPVIEDIKKMAEGSNVSVNQMFSRIAKAGDVVDKSLSAFDINEAEVMAVRGAINSTLETFSSRIKKAQDVLDASSPAKFEVPSGEDIITRDITKDDWNVVLKALPDVVEISADDVDVKQKIKSIITNLPDAVKLNMDSPDEIETILGEFPKEVEVAIDTSNLEGLEVKAAFVSGLSKTIETYVDMSKVPDVVSLDVAGAGLDKLKNVETVFDTVVGSVEAPMLTATAVIQDAGELENIPVLFPTDELNAILKTTAVEADVSPSDLLKSIRNMSSSLGAITIGEPKAFMQTVDDAIEFSNLFDKKISQAGRTWPLKAETIENIKTTAISTVEDVLRNLQDIPGDIPIEAIAKNIPKFIELVAKGDLEDERAVEVLFHGPDLIEYKAEWEQPEITMVAKQMKKSIEFNLDDKNFDFGAMSVFMNAMDVFVKNEDVVLGKKPGVNMLFETTKLGVPVGDAEVVLGGMKDIYVEATVGDVKIDKTPEILFDSLTAHYDDPTKIKIPSEGLKAAVDAMGRSLASYVAAAEGVEMGDVDIDKSSLSSSMIDLRGRVDDAIKTMNMSLEEMATATQRFTKWEAPSPVGWDGKESTVDMAGVVNWTFRSVKLPEDKQDDFAKLITGQAGGILTDVADSMEALSPDARKIVDEKMPRIFDLATQVQREPEEVRGQRISGHADKLRMEFKRSKGVDVPADTFVGLLTSISDAMESPVKSLGMMSTRTDEFAKGLEYLVQQGMAVDSNDIEITRSSAKYLVNLSEVDKLVAGMMSDIQKSLPEDIALPKNMLSGAYLKRDLLDRLLRINKAYTDSVEKPSKALKVLLGTMDVKQPAMPDVRTPLMRIAEVFPMVGQEVANSAKAFEIPDSEMYAHFSTFYNKTLEAAEASDMSVEEFVTGAIDRSQHVQAMIAEGMDISEGTVIAGDNELTRTFDNMISWFDSIDLKDIKFSDFAGKFEDIYTAPTNMLENMQAFFNKTKKVTDFLTEFSDEGLIPKGKLEAIQTALSAPDFKFERITGAIDALQLFGEKINTATAEVVRTEKAYGIMQKSPKATAATIEVARMDSVKAAQALLKAQADYDDKQNDTFDMINNQYGKYAKEQVAKATPTMPTISATPKEAEAASLNADRERASDLVTYNAEKQRLLIEERASNKKASRVYADEAYQIRTELFGDKYPSSVEPAKRSKIESEGRADIAAGKIETSKAKYVVNLDREARDKTIDAELMILYEEGQQGRIDLAMIEGKLQDVKLPAGEPASTPDGMPTMTIPFSNIVPATTIPGGDVTPFGRGDAVYTIEKQFNKKISQMQENDEVIAVQLEQKRSELEKTEEDHKKLQLIVRGDVDAGVVGIEQIQEKHELDAPEATETFREEGKKEKERARKVVKAHADTAQFYRKEGEPMADLGGGKYEKIEGQKAITELSLEMRGLMADPTSRYVSAYNAMVEAKNSGDAELYVEATEKFGNVAATAGLASGTEKAVEEATKSGEANLARAEELASQIEVLQDRLEKRATMTLDNFDWVAEQAITSDAAQLDTLMEQMEEFGVKGTMAAGIKIDDLKDQATALKKSIRVIERQQEESLSSQKDLEVSKKNQQLLAVQQDTLATFYEIQYDQHMKTVEGIGDISTAAAQKVQDTDGINTGPMMKYYDNLLSNLDSQAKNIQARVKTHNDMQDRYAAEGAILDKRLRIFNAQGVKREIKDQVVLQIKQLQIAKDKNKAETTKLAAEWAALDAKTKETLSSMEQGYAAATKADIELGGELMPELAEKKAQERAYVQSEVEAGRPRPENLVFGPDLKVSEEGAQDMIKKFLDSYTKKERQQVEFLRTYGKDVGVKSEQYQTTKGKLADYGEMRITQEKAIVDFEKASGESMAATISKTGLQVSDILRVQGKIGAPAAAKTATLYESEAEFLEPGTEASRKLLGEFRAWSERLPEPMHPKATGGEKVLVTPDVVREQADAVEVGTMKAIEKSKRTPTVVTSDGAAPTPTTPGEAAIVPTQVPDGMGVPAGPGIPSAAQDLMAAPVVSSVNLIVEGLTIQIDNVNGLDHLAAEVRSKVDTETRRIVGAIEGYGETTHHGP